jgi:hypothetical protein
MHPPKWVAIVAVIVLGLSLRVLFVWTPSSKRGTIVSIVLSVLLGLLSILLGSGYIRL